MLKVGLPACRRADTGPQLLLKARPVLSGEVHKGQDPALIAEQR